MSSMKSMTKFLFAAFASVLMVGSVVANEAAPKAAKEEGGGKEGGKKPRKKKT